MDNLSPPFKFTFFAHNISFASLASLASFASFTSINNFTFSIVSPFQKFHLFKSFTISKVSPFQKFHLFHSFTFSKVSQALNSGPGLFSHLLTLCTLVLVLATLPFSLFFVVKVVQVRSPFPNAVLAFLDMIKINYFSHGHLIVYIC